MSHPEDLLADYVDGTLDEGERAGVDAHLHGCERCRDEVRLAGSAKLALGELEDRPVPFGVTGPVLAEAGRRFERRRGVAWERSQWAAGLAAAAALIVVVALNVGGGEPQEAAAPAAATGATGGGAAEAATPGVLPFRGLETQPEVNYDKDGIRAVATQSAREVVAADSAFQSSQALAGAADRASNERTNDAKACIEQSGLDVDGGRDVLIRLIEAEYQGTPAYIAVFAEGPGVGQPPDHIVVWVVATDDCSSFLTTASQRIPPG